METRARYVLIGLFTIGGFLGALGFVLWLAKVQLDRTYSQYDILFTTVAGLSQASAVRYNGVDVGTVLTIALDYDDPALVRVRIQVLASTPVRTDTRATLASQGVTGVSFVALDGGSAEAERLRPGPGGDVPEMRAERSGLQGLMESAPDLVEEATTMIAEFRGFATDENRAAIAGILANLRDATGRIDSIANRAEETLTRVDLVLDNAASGLGAVDTLLQGDIPALVAGLREAVVSAVAAMDSIRGVAQGDLPRISTQVSSLILEASRVIATFDALGRQIGNDPGRFLLGTETPAYRRSQ